MKKYSIIKMGFILFMTLLILAGCADNTESSNEHEDDNPSSLIDNEEKIQEESDSKEPVIIKGTRKYYEVEGKDCKQIEDTIERGDCFLTLNTEKFRWFIDESKTEFYFPFQREQDHWEEVFYLNIDENDNLSEMIHADGYENYLEIGYTEEDIERAVAIIEKHWDVFSTIIPKEDREFLKSIVWMNTGDDFIFAVYRDEDNVQDTQLIFSHLIRSYHPYVIMTLIHEYAHMFTLDDSQGEIDPELFVTKDETILEQAAEACPTFFFWSCMDESSYLNQYYLAFWEDITSDFEEINWDSEDDYKDFFFNYEDRFFNSYQGTSPIEDIADAFTQFIMMNSQELVGQTEMKYEKIEFFYQYDELVELRTKILENIFKLVK